MEALSSPSDILNARNEVGATGPYQVVSFGHVPRCILDVDPAGTERPSSAVDLFHGAALTERGRVE